MKDPDRIARTEKAISQKYGDEAVTNPRANWDEEKKKNIWNNPKSFIRSLIKKKLNRKKLT